MAQANPFVVIVEFSPKDEVSRDDCLRLLADNARKSREIEQGCLRFDVVETRDPGAPIFLYELYQDEAAFEFHLKTSHYREFDAAASALFDGKKVHVGTLISTKGDEAGATKDE